MLFLKILAAIPVTGFCNVLLDTSPFAPVFLLFCLRDNCILFIHSGENCIAKAEPQVYLYFFRNVTTGTEMCTSLASNSTVCGRHESDAITSN